MNLFPSNTNTNAYNPTPSSVSNLDKILQQHSLEKTQSYTSTVFTTIRNT